MIEVKKEKIFRLEKDLFVDINYQILFEDDYFLVVDKSAPLPVHPVGSFKEKTLLSLLEKKYPKLIGSLRIINRLDSETSGVMLVAKSKDAKRVLAAQFERRTVEKEYLAIVMGLPEKTKGRIAVSLASRVENEFHLMRPDEDGKRAVTHYQVLKSFDRCSLLRLIPETGRTHQLRAHLASINCPIVGDKMYIDLSVFDQYVKTGWQDEMTKIVGLPRLALHASKLAINHPTTQERMIFSSKMPEMFINFLEQKSVVE